MLYIIKIATFAHEITAKPSGSTIKFSLHDKDK